MVDILSIVFIVAALALAALDIAGLFPGGTSWGLIALAALMMIAVFT